MRLEEHPLIKTALTHRSLAAIEGVRSNEMLEFLGDRVLDLLVTELIMAEYPEMNEGTATKLRTTVCNTESVAGLCRRFDWHTKLRLPRAAKQQALRKDLKVQADTFEAVIGAWFQIYNLDYVREKLKSPLRRIIRERAGAGEWYDGKVEINDLAQKLKMRPRYSVQPLRVKGGFEATVSLEGVVYGKATGQTAKMAEQAAARDAVRKIKTSFSDRLRGTAAS